LSRFPQLNFTQQRNYQQIFSFSLCIQLHLSLLLDERSHSDIFENNTHNGTNKMKAKKDDPYLYEGVTYLTISCNYHKLNEKPNTKEWTTTFPITYNAIQVWLVECIVIIEPFSDGGKLHKTWLCSPTLSWPDIYLLKDSGCSWKISVEYSQGCRFVLLTIFHFFIWLYELFVY
jgi:hypothetical protein